LFTDKERFKSEFLEKLERSYGKNINQATPMDLYKTLGSMVREYVSKNWMNTNQQYAEQEVKQVYYFSIEFLLGRLMGSNLLNLGVLQMCQEALQELGLCFDDIEVQEADAGLGNGGLGRLAACFLDSIASLQLPGHGYGIRYKYGLFEQKIVDGFQVELPEQWLREGNVWEIRNSGQSIIVKFGGKVEMIPGKDKLTFEHKNYEPVLAVPYDTPVVGFNNKTVNTLRLWSAETVANYLQAEYINGFSYQKAVEYKRTVEAISEFLYPDDSSPDGRLLRLKQEYFLVSAGVQHLTNVHRKKYGTLKNFHEKVAIHINDTHPVLAIPELMRILLDEEGMSWDEAWGITVQTISFTNHTTLSEALETWSVELFRGLLPRIYMIVEEINERYCKELWNRYPGDWDRIHKMAIIADGYVKMAHLAIVGSHSVNGVAQLHTDILKKREMKLFHQYYPGKFNNKTNGITHRRWLLKSNPELSQLLKETIGDSWVKEPSELKRLLEHANDASLQEQLEKIKLKHKISLANIIQDKTGIPIDPHSIFDVQVKRLHAYKRQLLNILHIMHLYNKLQENPNLPMVPRTFIFGAKAAPGYHLAKRIIKLINSVADKINHDPICQDKLKVIFMENYRVSLAEKIFPAAELSEQISTASKEASGTGNMKFMMNGALTIGTLDGANIEIQEAVGLDNIFIFGLTSSEVLNYYQVGGYNAWEMYHRDRNIRRVLDQLVDGTYSYSNSEFESIYQTLLHHNDEFFVLRDFSSYADAQLKVDQSYQDRPGWLKKSIINIAHSGRFSSDRTIQEYASEIWKTKPYQIK